MADRIAAGVLVRDVTVLRGRVQAVRAVSACFKPGQWHGLIGANGSGKTTLLRAIAGRLPIESGHCLVDGVDQAENRAARARAMGFAPLQEMLPASLLVREVLAIIAGSLDSAAAALGGVSAALELQRLLELRIGDCSTGVRQRIAIACAFASGRPIVILDEPFNWLDPVVAFELRAALRSMVEEGLTLVTALHDLTTLVTSCDEATLMAGGRVALAISKDEMCSAASDPILFEQRTIDVLRSGPSAHT